MRLFTILTLFFALVLAAREPEDGCKRLSCPKRREIIQELNRNMRKTARAGRRSTDRDERLAQQLELSTTRATAEVNYDCARKRRCKVPKVLRVNDICKKNERDEFDCRV